jgi:hypothetical protein
MQQTSLNRTWLLKIGVFALAMIGFGIWALLDAAYFFPNRGLADASAKLRIFLASAEHAGLLRADKAATPDPHATLSELRAKAEQLKRDAPHDTSEGRAAQMELDRLEWLESLSRAWKLDASVKPLGEYTVTMGGLSTHKRLTFNPATGLGSLETSAPGGPAKTEELPPQSLLGELNTYSQAAPTPTALHGWDLPVQWSFVAIGFGLGGYLVFLLARCAATARAIRFDEKEQRLTLPSGASFVPGDIQDVDKRLWHKYYVTIITNDGVHHKLDLLRYVPLEEWVLAMERTRFPERAAEEKQEAAAGAGGSEGVGAENPAA